MKLQLEDRINSIQLSKKGCLIRVKSFDMDVKLNNYMNRIEGQCKQEDYDIVCDLFDKAFEVRFWCRNVFEIITSLGEEALLKSYISEEDDYIFEVSIIEKLTK
jgi:hypothetical protein